MKGEDGWNDEAATALIKLQEENQTLQEENFSLRHDINDTEEKVQQLTHELTTKENLVKFYHKELEDFEGSAPESRRCSVNVILTNLDNKSRSLEREKLALALEIESRKDDLEEKEAKLDILKQNYNRQIETLKDKLAMNDESIRAHEDRNVALQRDLDSLRKKVVDWDEEVEKVKQQLEKRENEVEEYRDREDTMMEEMEVKQDELEKMRRMYEERRDEVKRLRLLNPARSSRTRSYSAGDTFQRQGSIRDELEESVRREGGETSNPPSPGMSPFSSIFETFRSVTSSPIDIPGSGRPRAGTFSGIPRRMELESNCSICGDSGCDDLSDDETLPTSVHPHTPPDTARRKGLGYGYPKKLQIVKPLEGSETLRRWKELATPNLASFLEPREGIFSKHESSEPIQFFDSCEGGHSLDDLEEDDDPGIVDECDNNHGNDEPKVITQSLTEDFLHGVSGFGVLQNPRHPSVETSETGQTFPRDRSPSLVERVKKCGIKACASPAVDDNNLSKSPLQDHLLSTLARFLFPTTDGATRAITYPTQLGLTYQHVPAWERDPMDTLAMPVNSWSSPSTSPIKSPSNGDFGLSNHFTDTKPVLRAISDKLDHCRDANSNCEQESQTSETVDTKVTGKARTKENKRISPRKRNAGKFRIKLDSKKSDKPMIENEVYQNKDHIQVLDMITTLRQQNLLAGGIPDPLLAQESSYYDPILLDDISLDIFSAPCANV